MQPNPMAETSKVPSFRRCMIAPLLNKEKMRRPHNRAIGRLPMAQYAKLNPQPK
jgi:hypothetical protein